MVSGAAAQLFLLCCRPATQWACRYVFIENNETDFVNKLGPFAWLAIAMSTVETLIVVKFGKGMFPNPWPRTTLLVWAAVLSVFCVVMAAWSVQHYLLSGRTKRKNE